MIFCFFHRFRYEAAKCCWSEEPEKRPSIYHLNEFLETILNLNLQTDAKGTTMKEALKEKYSMIILKYLPGSPFLF